MRKKVFTKDCPSCEFCSVQDNSNFVCSWGQGKKNMISPKRKKVISCNLIRRD
ncbi:MAG: hypothetical protein ACFFG0_01810 [Candidatus Thorarchaeota archaeon]